MSPTDLADTGETFELAERQGGSTLGHDQPLVRRGSLRAPAGDVSDRGLTDLESSFGHPELVFDLLENRAGNRDPL